MDELVQRIEKEKKRKEREEWLQGLQKKRRKREQFDKRKRPKEELTPAKRLLVHESDSENDEIEKVI